MDLTVYYSAGPFKKLLLCCLLCFPPGYLLLFFIAIVYLVIMMILPAEPEYHKEYNYDASRFHEYNGNLRAPYEVNNGRVEDHSGKQENEKWRREREKNYNAWESSPASSTSSPPVNVEDYSKYEFDLSSSDWESSSISSSDSSVSTSSASSTVSSTSTERTFSTSASSLRARAELNIQADDSIKQAHERWRLEKQVDNSPLRSPILSPHPPFYKVGKNGNKYAAWTRDEVLIYVAYYQTLEGKKSTSKFNEGWWEAVIDGFFWETGVKYDKEQIKVRLRNMRKEWKAWTKVMNTAGFGWDPLDKIIRADDKCWNAYIEANPEAEIIRESTFPLYEELTVIFNYLGADQLHKEIKIPEEYLTENRRRRKMKRASSGSDRKGTKNTTVSFSITDCSNVLHNMEGVQQTSEAALKAYDEFQYPGRREAFMVMKAEQRLAWLKTLGSISS